MNGVWIKPSGPTFAPRCLVSVVAQTRPVPHVSIAGRTVNELRHISVAYSFRKYDRWSSPVYCEFDSGTAFHDWLERFAADRKRTYVVTPVANHTLTLTGFFDRLDQLGCKLVRREKKSPGVKTHGGSQGNGTDNGAGRKAIDTASSSDTPTHYHISGWVLGNNADIVKYRVGGKSYVWVSNRNYFNGTEDEIASAINYNWPIWTDPAPGLRPRGRTSGERSLMWLRAYQHLADWWRDIDGGPWGFTRGMLSYSFLRKHMPAKTVLTHDDKYVAYLEECALFGGRRTQWFYGNIGTAKEWESAPGNAPIRSELPTLTGGMTHCDIRSMYPHLLATYQFPIQLLYKNVSTNPSHLLELCQSHGVIATVFLETNDPEYPKRHGQNIVYPVGRFKTTLCGMELVRAIANKEVKHVYGSAVYKLGNPFADASNKLLKLRLQAREENQLVWELFIKAISNAMAGKLAQRKQTWVEQPRKAGPIAWGEWIDVDGRTGQSTRYRAIAGMVWQQVQCELSSRPMGAAFCYLTMYGREMMRCLRSYCSPKSVISQDTDGIWLRSPAVDSLPIGLDGSEYLPGDLRITQRSATGLFWSPQHYWYNGIYILSGYSMPVVDPDKLRVSSRELTGFIPGTPHAPLQVVLDKEIIKHLGSMPSSGPIQPDGWIAPPLLWELPPDC